MSTPNILVVDDSLVVVKTLQIKLAAAGFSVLTARDGSEAIGIVRREQPDLIVLDIGFPPDVEHGGGVAWDGFMILQWLRRMEEAQDTPVIIITGLDPAKYRDQAMKLGAIDFFTKPVDHQGLIEAIKRALGDAAKPVASEA